MKSTIKSIAFLLASSGFASAASIIANNLVDTNFTTPTDVALGSTYTAKIGFSSTTVFDSTDNFASISATWTNAGDIAFASGDAAGYAGYFSGQVNFTDALGLAGQNVFIWVTDGANSNAILTTNTVQYLADAAIPNSNNVQIDSTTLADFDVLLGSFNGAGANSGTGGSLVLNVVPEPSAALLGALGVLGLLRRRRN